MSESEINTGDWIELTEAVPQSIVYPWVKEGAKGVVSTVHPNDYSIMFPGQFTCDPDGHPARVTDPVLIFLPEEIKAAED